ncbi:WW domain binding protein 2 [Aspergillus nanangensis]|uniref:WW domain binding protein 2 n=1 Tax=Aspergillus nanangensis TaxID=2582783 RepID=A0AAD4CK31_ASPNN|nr:WW domain binding protein 2 [Aspergillus nanangensis]
MSQHHFSARTHGWLSFSQSLVEESRRPYQQFNVRIKERLQQAVEVSQESRRGATNIDMSNVHLEELPAYSGPSNNTSETASVCLNTTTNAQNEPAPSEQPRGPELIEPPPGYEEVQQQSIADELEARLRRAN